MFHDAGIGRVTWNGEQEHGFGTFRWGVDSVVHGFGTLVRPSEFYDEMNATASASEIRVPNVSVLRAAYDQAVAGL